VLIKGREYVIKLIIFAWFATLGVVVFAGSAHPYAEHRNEK